MNLAIAWAAAAWIAPSGARGVFRAAKLDDGAYEAFTTRRRFGHTRLSRAILASLGNYPHSGQIVEIEWSITGDEYSETRAGWPLHSLSCRNYAEVEMRDAGGATSITKSGPNPIVGGIQLDSFRMGGSTAMWRALPYHPLWPGLIVNTLLYAGLLGIVVLLPGWARRSLRRRRHQCESCGYPVGSSPVCTECGSAIKADTLPSRS